MAEKQQELSKSRQALLDKVLKLFEGKRLDWTKGWSSPGAPLPPVSGVSGTRYHGCNNVLLWLVAIERGYTDNRWVTYHQIEENGWRFKKNEGGESLGKGAGVAVELFRYYDKATKQDLDWSEFRKLTLDEQRAYWEENVRRITRYYTVFNGDVVEGMPPLEQTQIRHLTPEERDERAEQLIRAWNDKQCRIIHDGGNSAYYQPATDQVHLPERTSFHSIEEYYGTALHEIGHSTGHPSRLNRDLSGGFGSDKYAREELRAEFASIFMQQELGLPLGEYHIKNHAAYLQSWGAEVKKDPNVLFDAIKDAGRISTCVFENAAGMEASAASEAESQREGMESPLFAMVSSMPDTEGVAAPAHTEQTANADSPFLRAMLGEDVNE